MAVLLREQSQVLLAKLETTYGTDPAPTGADALYVRNISIQTDLDKAERNNITGFMGAQGSITTGASVSIDFEMELAPSGTAGTPPHYASVLRACGLAEVISDTNGDAVNDTVEYTPVGSGFESVTFYWQVDGLRHSVSGARGQVSLSLNSQDIPVLKFSFKGLYNAPVAAQAAPAGVDFSTIESALGVYKETVPLVQMFAEPVRMKTLEANLGNDVQLIRNIAEESVEIIGRNGQLSTSFHVDDAQYAALMERARTDATTAFAFQLGNTAGKIFKLDVPNIQLSGTPNISWDNGVAVASIDAAIVPVTANSDFTLTFK